MADKTANTILRYKVDQASVNQAISANDKIAAAEAQLAENARIAREEARKAQQELNEGNRLELEQRRQDAARRAQLDAQRLASTQQIASAAQNIIEVEQRQVPIIKQLSFQTRMLGAEIGDIGGAGAQKIAALESRFSNVRQEISAAATQARELKRELLEVGGTGGTTVSTAPVAASSSPGSTGSVRRTTASRTVRRSQFVNVASQGLSQAGLGEAGQAINIIDDLGTSLGALGPVGAVAAGAIAGVVIGIQLLNKQLEGVKRTLDAALTAQRQYYRAVNDLTSEQVREQITNLRTQRRIIGVQISETFEQLRSNFRQGELAIGNFIQIADALDWTPYNSLNQRLAELTQQAEASDFEIARLTQGLQANAFAANDARVAIEDLTNKLDSGIQQLGQAAGDAVRYSNQISHQTRSALRDQLLDRQEEREAILASREAIEPWIEASAAAREEYDKYTDQLYEVNGQIAALTSELNKSARAVEVWDRVKSFFSNAVETVVDIGDRINAAGEINKRIAEVRGEGFEDLVKIELDLQEKIIDVTQDAADRRNEVMQDAQKDEEKNLRDYQRQRSRLERDSNRELLSAIGRRDVLAFIEEKRQREDALSDLQDDLAEERRTRQEAADERLRDIQRNEQKQIDTARRSASLQIGLVNQRVAEEVRAQQLLLGQTLGFTQSRVAIETQGYQAIASAATSAFQQIFAAIPNLIVGNPNSKAGNSSINYNINGQTVPLAEYLRVARNSIEINGRGR